MKALFFAVVALSLVACPLAGAAADQQVKGQGCVQAGVEAGCLVVKDAPSGRLYNLLIKGAKPPVGAGINFVGAPANAANTCMQGAAVLVTTWSRNDSLQCGKGRAKSVQ